MSGPTPKPELDKEKTARETTGATTRQEQLETSEVRGNVPPGHDADIGRAGGNLERDIGTKDELQQQTEIEGEKTRVHKGEEKHVPKPAGEANRPGEYRNPDKKHGQSSQSTGRSD